MEAVVTCEPLRRLDRRGVLTARRGGRFSLQHADGKLWLSVRPLVCLSRLGKLPWQLFSLSHDHEPSPRQRRSVSISDSVAKERIAVPQSHTHASIEW